jgi:hypothetical protein
MSVQLAEFKSQLCHLLAVCAWANHLTSLCLSSLSVTNMENDTSYLKELLWGVVRIAKNLRRAGVS